MPEDKKYSADEDHDVDPATVRDEADMPDAPAPIPHKPEGATS